MSFYTSLSGLQAAQIDMTTISHNLANVSTNGFKKSRTEFADVIASSVSTSPTQQVGSGTVIKAVRQQFAQGAFVQSASTLDIAITGDGFFAVKPQVESATVAFTRNGGFLVNNDRYVVDGQGGHLQVYPVDGSGTVVATGLESTINLRLPETSGVPEATQNVELALNLPSSASIPADSTQWTTARPYAFDRFDASTYNQSTSTTVYDSGGNAMTMTSYFVRDTAATAAAPNSKWTVRTFVGDQELADAAGNPIELTFDNTGALSTPSTPTAYASFTPAGSTESQSISLDFGSLTTQLAQPFNVGSRIQDGKAVGQITGVAIDKDGTVKASFSNGATEVLGKVALATFSNPSGLRQLGSSYWASTGLSGEAKLGSPGENGLGSLMSSTIERSNVDITEELVGLIAAQRNFQANAKALDTASQISQTIFNIRS
jgi:flagellar hook protein FlgE